MAIVHNLSGHVNGWHLLLTITTPLGQKPARRLCSVLAVESKTNEKNAYVRVSLLSAGGFDFFLFFCTQQKNSHVYSYVLDKRA